MAVRRLQEVVRLRVRALRVERGLTQEELCERAGISVDAVNRIEGGSRVPSLGTLERLASALEVGVADLLGGPAPRRPKPSTIVRRIAALMERQPVAVQEAIETVVRAVLRAIRASSPPARS